MKFDGDIIIIDPFYLSENIRCGVDSDLSNLQLNDSTIFSNSYIWKNTETIYNRWKVSEILENTTSIVDFIDRIELAYSDFFNSPNKKNQENLEKLISKRNTIGRFLTDNSNTYGIFYLKDVLKYNPKLLEKYGDWCYTVIKDFHGDIDIYIDRNKLFHIIGTGNKNFYSNTVSWM